MWDTPWLSETDRCRYGMGLLLQSQANPNGVFPAKLSYVKIVIDDQRYQSSVKSEVSFSEGKAALLIS